jgi:ATP-dependent RNA helicase DeaD
MTVGTAPAAVQDAVSAAKVAPVKAEGASVSPKPDAPIKTEPRPKVATPAAEKVSASQSPEKPKYAMKIPEKRDLVMEPAPVRSPKASRKTPDFQKRIYMNVGEEMGVTPDDVIQAIQGETGFPAKVIGTVDIRERHLFVDVSAEHANSILAKLKRTQIKGHKVKAKEA